ncbi:hypothetical protein QVD17_39862 [Tagetes erecta]|uniref:Transmembrane protein n=1 Tax=Tagetes erecta TaxID=13708 RepID=A0AAD8NGM8_TARER|nr:hypothetical protein QVD17_39862 [Tagetes erecta]
MDLKLDVRFLLLPLANHIFHHYTSVIIITLLLFVSIKVPVSLELTTSHLLRVQAIDLSISVTICFLCLIFMSTPHFWIVNSFLILFLSPWDELLVKMLKIVFWWLCYSLRSVHTNEVLCIFNDGHDEDEHRVDLLEELSLEVNDNFVVVDVDAQLEF